VSSPEGPLGVPRAIARELIRDCVREASLRTDEGRWIAGVITAVLGIRVDRVTVHERRGGRRYAEVGVNGADAARFQEVLPEATRLTRRTGLDTAVFRIRC
jgi:hypothetical protein